MSKRAIASWLGVVVANGVLDYFAHRTHRATFSAFTRHAFRVHHPAGELAFTSFLVGVGLVVWRHIVRGGEHK